MSRSLTSSIQTHASSFGRGIRSWLRTPDARWLLAILVAATAIRLVLLPTTAHLTEIFTDEFTFKRHVVLIHERGLIETFRDTNTSYIFYHYVLWLLATVYGWFGGAFDTDAMSLKALVKVPPLLLDLALVAGAYFIARELWQRDRTPLAPLGIAALVAFHPVVVYDSAVWAQIDAAVALSGLGAFAFAASGRPVAACVMLAFGLLNKPQPIIFAPVVLVLIYRCSGVRGIARGVAAGLVFTLIPLLPWLAAGDADRLVEVYRKLFSNNGNVTALTQNAWNLWWFIPFETVPEAKDVMFSVGGLDVTYQRFSLLLSASAALVAAAYAWRYPTLRGGLLAAGYISIAFYVLPTSTHERYMYPMVALLAPLLLIDGRVRYIYAILSATLFVNMLLVAPPVESWMLRWDDALITHYIAGLNVIVFGVFTWLLVQDAMWLPRSTADAPAAAPAEPEGA
jgi:Gpi18-like mannosyltransferase